jgi:polyhydroxybutyrate depolymerase
MLWSHEGRCIMPGTPANRSNDSAQPYHQTSVFHDVWLAMVVCTMLLTSCGSSGDTHSVGRIINRPVTTIGCGTPAPTHAGASVDQMIPSGGLSRSYRLHLPTGYSIQQPQALILAFHGYSADVHDFEPSSSLSRLSDQQGFIAVYPQGTGSPSAWASGGAGDPPVDDVLFVSDLLTHLQTTLCIDAQRIYAAGASNGGGMVGLLACKLAQRIAAFAAVAGAFYPTPGGCHPGRSVPVLEFHGTADSVVSYTSPSNGWEAIPDWLHEWVQRDGCSSEPRVFVQTADATGEQWSGCRAGGTVVHYRIAGGQHYLLQTTDTINIVAIIWNFFDAHPLPGE